MHMSKLGKSFKNKFLRRALAMLLAGTMVLSGMPVSFAAEQQDAGSTVETELQGRTENVSEEAAEEDEVAQKESEETEAGEESRKPSEESETISKEGTTVQSDKESENAETETYEITSVIETEESETNTEETETEQTTEEEENEASYTSSDAAVLAENHTYAVWGLSETLIKSDGTNATADSTGRIVIQSGNKGIYKNSAEDILYIDTAGSSGNGKFGQGESDIQIKANTKIYIPVKADNHTAKIIIYQKNAKTLSTVINREGSDGYFDLTGEALSSVECTLCEAVGNYYKAELVCTLTDGAESAAICVEVKKDNYATKIISGEEVRDDVYDDTAGASADFVKYNMEGYANAYGVTGGGVMKTDAAHYYTVSNAEDFLKKLVEIKKHSEPAVIRITDNLNLGSKEIENFADYNSVITANTYQALWHPVLKRSGVSDLNLTSFKNLTIFSTNGAAIKHCNIIFKRSENIIFRNLVFDELWEWDDGGTIEDEILVNGELKKLKQTYDRGGYDRNDWDYICIDSESDGIWIDHCTFYKAYDGVIDVKHAKGEGEDERVTISWCKFEPMSAPKIVDGKTTHPFYDAQIEYLEKNEAKTTYYKQLKMDTKDSFDITYRKYTIKDNESIDNGEVTETLEGAGYSKEDIITYTCGQKKTHLLGQSDTDTSAKGIRVTLANNSYKNSMDRMPRLRYGKAHVYNCVLDASELYKAHYVDEGGNKFDKHLVSNGALSTLEGWVYLENCYLDGIKTPLVSGNDNSAPGYIGANSNCIYILNGEDKTSELKPANNNSSSYTGSKDVLEIKNISELNLPDNYGDYSLYNDVSELASYLSGKAGAGVVVMNPIRWTKTNYNGTTDTSITDEKDDTDPARNDNTDYSIGEEGGGDTPPETDPDDGDEKKDFSLNAEEIEWIDITQDSKGNYERKLSSDYSKNNSTENNFVIKATSEKYVSVVKSEKTAEDGTKFTQLIKLNGTANKDSRSIYFTTKGGGKLTVYAVSGSSGTSRNLVVFDENFTAITGLSQPVDSLTRITYDISGAGSYYIGSSQNGINIYSLAFHYTPEEGGDNPPTPPVIEYPEDSLILDANKLPDITIETEQKINSQYTIIGTSDAAVTIGNINEDGSAITIKEKEFSKQIQLGGAGDPTKRTIKITVAEAGKLAVYAQTKGTENGTLVLKGDLETSQEAANSVTASEPAVIEYTVSEAGTYYLYSTDSNINIFYAEYTADPADEGEKTDTFYDASEGNSAELTKYNLEGFAASARVTGGGLLKEGSKNYYVVTNEQEFIDALNSVRSLGTEGGLKPAEEIKPAVIEIQKDLNLGYLELKNQGIDIDQKPAKTVIEKHTKQPLIHPTLKETGVSKIKLNYFHNLTIYSKNGNSIKHCGISFEGATSNIIIRNITFDEFWEWDEKTSGNYDENDWDYMTVDEQTDGLWVDHCTFYKAYDGIIDVRGDNKKQIDRQRVTISWCEFLPGSKSNTFFDAQMDYLETNKSRTTYYKRLRDTENMSEEDVWWYAYGQKKTHLFGADDSMEYASMIRVTMANNYYKNSMDRMPRLRYGKVHEYNCILDAQDLYDRRETAKHITSNGAISTCGGEVLLENCQIKGIENPLLSGNGSSPTGYINAVKSLYYLNGVETELKPAQKGSGALLITDVEKFKNAIPYKNYVVYDASTLESTVMPGAGAGKINMSTVQWEKVSYGARSTDVTEDYTEGVYGGDAPDKPTAVPGSESQATAVAAGTKIELNAEGADNIYYTTGTTPEDTADPKNSQSGRQRYDAETGIVITEAVTIKAVAEKGNRYSEVAAYTYTIAGGDTPVTPPDPDDPDNPDNPVEVKTISLDDCVITVPAAIYNNKTGNKQSTAYVIYQYTDANGNQNHVRFVEGVDYEAEWKKAGNNYSVILTGSGRSADGRDVDTYIIDEKSSKEIPYKVYATAKDANLINISKAKVDFKAAKKTALKNVYYTGYAYEIEVGDLDFSKDKSGLKDVPQEYLRVACSNNINAGKAAVTISVDPAYSDGKYAGVKTLSFTIKKAALNKNANKATAAVSFDKTASAAQPYMGTAVEAKDLQVAAKNGVKLRKNEDYTVTYKNGVKDGKVNVTVTVKGVGNNLSGTWSDTFAISQLDLGSQSVEINTKNSAIPYSPKGAKLGTITITKDGSTCTLKEGVDYNAKYEYDPAKKYNVGGKATAVITGKGACKGTRRIANLEIIAADFNSDEHIIVSGDVTVDKDAYNKNKTKAIEKAVTVTDASGVKLKVGKDFKIEEHADTKTLVIHPVGSNAQNYTGTKTVPYRIATNLAKDKSFVFDKTKEKNDPLVYDGRNPVKLTTKDIDKYINKMSSDAANYDQRKYRLGGSNANIEIVPGTYKNNAKKGTAQVTVRGVAGVDDGFYGTKVLKFKIVEQ